MPRIIAGTLGGRTIPSPPTDLTRPTSDRVREAIFSKLEAWGVIAGARVLDLYAGTGALGVEAISRGAIHARAIEAHKPTAAKIVTTAHDLGIADRLVVDLRTIHVGLKCEDGPYNLIFADPPYCVSTESMSALIEQLAVSGALADEATLVIERSSRSELLTLGSAFVDEGSKQWGDTRVEYFTYLDPEISTSEQPEQTNAQRSH